MFDKCQIEPACVERFADKTVIFFIVLLPIAAMDMHQVWRLRIAGHEIHALARLGPVSEIPADAVLFIECLRVADAFAVERFRAIRKGDTVVVIGILDAFGFVVAMGRA